MAGMMKSVLVLGAGSAGLLAAVAFKRKLPGVTVRVVRSPEIGVIGVGESTTPNVPAFLFDYLGISRRKFYELAEPTWKLGIHFLWGPRDSFEYSFVQQMDVRLPELARPNGFYCDDDFTALNVPASMMSLGKAFVRLANNAGPDIDNGHAFHLENIKLVKTLEVLAMDLGIEFIDARMSGTEPGLDGISAIVLEDGRRLSADFFVDASGFRSELLGKALAEPFVSFDRQLFNDRTILASWERTNEPILPYTTAETMNAGWSWRIDHERIINRGYVYSSAHLSDDQARHELATKNPKAKINDRVVRFRCGRHQRGWVGNVMAIGNAFGFVEPLEATSLMFICTQCQTFLDLISYVGPTESVRDLFNQTMTKNWDEIRDFLTLHFKFNTRLDTPYWEHCRRETDVSAVADFFAAYADNGPTGFNRYYLPNPNTQFGIEGFLAIMVGNQVPYKNRYQPSDAEQRHVATYRARNRATAQAAYTVAEGLAFIRHPAWRWHAEAAPVNGGR